MHIRVYPVPAAIQGNALQTACAVVIDALRMTSVAITALANGCSGIYAVAEVEEAEVLKAKFGALTGGERGALRIPGFDFANSPLEYTAERIAGQRLIMSTSNGTRAILAASMAQRMLLGAFLNAAAVADALNGEAHAAFICAGTMGSFTLEDALAAGAMTDRCLGRYEGVQLDDMALAAHRLYKAARPDLEAAVCGTVHVEKLRSLGLGADLAYCLREDITKAVPQRDRDGWFKAAQ